MFFQVPLKVSRKMLRYAGVTFEERCEDLAVSAGIEVPAHGEEYSEDELPQKLVFSLPQESGQPDLVVVSEPQNNFERLFALALYREIGNKSIRITPTIRDDAEAFYGDELIAITREHEAMYPIIMGFLNYDHVQLFFD